MRSPIEHEPNFIQAIGIITARWSLMEHQLASLLMRLMQSKNAANPAYFSLSSFSQRLAFVSVSAHHSVKKKREREVVDALFMKISRLWKTRNALIHSHYIHKTSTKGGGGWEQHIATMELGDHPDGYVPALTLRWLPPDGLSDSEKEEFDKAQDAGRKVVSREFGYLHWRKSGESTFTPVNLGTFENHARQLSKRVRQVATFTRYIDYGVIDLRDPYVSTLQKIPSPRSPHNQK